jgi:hypothetical protein
MRGANGGKEDGMLCAAKAEALQWSRPRGGLSPVKATKTPAGVLPATTVAPSTGALCGSARVVQERRKRSHRAARP